VFGKLIGFITEKQTILSYNLSEYIIWTVPTAQSNCISFLFHHFTLECNSWWRSNKVWSTCMITFHSKL